MSLLGLLQKELSPEQVTRSIVGLWMIGFIAASSATASSETSESLVQQGLERLGNQDYSGAEASFENAVDASTGDCGECQLGLAMVYSRTGDLKKGEKVARAATEQLKGHSSEYLAYGELGRICFSRGKRKPAYFAQAERAFRKALELSKEESKNARFYLGWSLMKQAKDKEGVAVLSDFVESYPDDENADFARRMISNPVSARKSMLPLFEGVTLKGKKLSTAELEGRVVLLDFWATWCGPCRTAIPSLKGIVKRFRNDPFTLISLSVDSDELILRDFVGKEEMSWPQIWDGRRRWSNRVMKVNKYPTYVLIGPKGEILHRTTGSGGRIESDLKRRIARAIKKMES